MPHKATKYKICVEGYFHANCSDWLQSLQVVRRKNGETMLIGSVVDQAALHGLLEYLFGLGITIISIQRIGKLHLSDCSSLIHGKVQKFF